MDNDGNLFENKNIFSRSKTSYYDHPLSLGKPDHISSCSVLRMSLFPPYTLEQKQAVFKRKYDMRCATGNVTYVTSEIYSSIRIFSCRVEHLVMTISYHWESPTLSTVVQ